MARKSWNEDYIPNEADWTARQEQMESWKKEHEDPRHNYNMTYIIDSIERSEVIMAVSEEDAIANLKQQWGMVGFVPQQIVARRIYES